MGNEGNIQELKKELRRKVKLLKENHVESAYFKESVEILTSVEMHPAFVNAQTVMAYWSIKGEVFTHDFVRKWSSKKRIILPSVDRDVMNLKWFDGSEKLIAGDLYGIPEPDGPLFTEYEMIDLIIVPGVAFDKKNNRMGRGKAYYDKFLHNLNAPKIGICFNFQLFDDIPFDANDIKMDVVICNSIRN